MDAVHIRNALVEQAEDGKRINIDHLIIAFQLRKAHADGSVNPFDAFDQHFAIRMAQLIRKLHVELNPRFEILLHASLPTFPSG